MPAEIFSLPLLGKNLARIDWHLDARGLEWTSPYGKDRWMPFACIRRVTLGQANGWRLRLSGPPGAVMFGTGTNPPSEDLQAFTTLSSRIIEGVTAAGCSVHFRLNHRALGPEWLWARGGKKYKSSQSLLASLPN